MNNFRRNSKPAWVRYQENQEARQDAARFEATHNIGNVIAQQTLSASKSEQTSAAFAAVVEIVAEAVRLEQLRERGGFSAIISAAIAQVTEGQTYKVVGSDLPLAHLLSARSLDIRNAAIKAAGI